MTSTSSFDSWVAVKIADIAERCGLNPLDSEVTVTWIPRKSDSQQDNNNPEEIRYILSAVVDALPEWPEPTGKQAKKFWDLLGLDEGGYRGFKSSNDLYATIERALSLAPRARGR